MSSVVNLASQLLTELFLPLPNSPSGMDQSSWMMLAVQEMKADWQTVLIEVGVRITVATQKMLESTAHLHQQLVLEFPQFQVMEQYIIEKWFLSRASNPSVVYRSISIDEILSDSFFFNRILCILFRGQYTIGRWQYIL